MKKIAIALTAIVVIGIIEIFAIVYKVDGVALSATIGAIASIATWRAVKATTTTKPPEK